MDPRDDELGIEELLGAQDFVRGLARRLLRDEHGAEDVAQGVMAAMLAHGAGERRESQGGLRAYLGGVVRRMVRDERRGAARREERERLAARPEGTPATDAFLAREEWRRRVVEAVLRLAPHEREVVLLRFFEDLPPRRIAERLGVPVETVKTRLKRALGRLRARLGKGRERGELLGGLGLLVGSPPGMLGGPVVLGTGAVLMQHATKIALFGLALVLAGVAYQTSRPARPAVEGLAGIAAPLAGAVASAGTTDGLFARAEEIRAAAQETEETRTGAQATARLQGRVVDHARFPVAGARLALVLPEGQVELGSSDGDGSFEVEAPLRGEVHSLHVLAHDGGRTSARRQISGPRSGEAGPGALDLGTLVLSPSHELTVQVTDGGDPVADAPVRVELGHGRALAFEVRTDGGGEARLEHLPRGTVHLAAGDARRGAQAQAFVPETERALLALAPLGAVEVRVVDLATDRPIAGAKVSLLESLPIPAALPGEEALHGNRAEFGTIRTVTTGTTGADGRTLLEGLHPGISYRLRPTAEGFREMAKPYLPRLEYGAAPLEVGLAPERPQAAPSTPAPGLCSLEVRVLDPRGEPVVGARVEARGTENRLLGEGGVTDGEGTALLAHLSAARTRIHVARAGESGRGRPVADVDLATGIGRVEVVLPARREVLLRLFIDGRPMLPSRFEVRDGSLPSEPKPTVVREDPATGEVLVELDDPGGSLRLAVAAPGFLRATPTVALPRDGSRAEAAVELERGALLRVRALRTERGSSRIVAERFDADSAAWVSGGETRHHSGLRHPNGPAESFVFDGLRAGLWRARDARTGKASEPVELGPARLEGEVELDLESIQIVAGRVEVDDPRELAQVRVLVLGLADFWGGGPAAEEPPVGVYVDPADGSFRTVVPGDRTVELRAWHPWLVPTGRVEVRSGTEGVVLRLGPGDELRVAMPPGHSERRAGSFRPAHALRIARFEPARGADSLGEPLEWHHAPIREGTARAALPRGSWTLWIDPGPGLAPRVVEDLEIEGVRELPASLFEPGATLRLGIPSAPDQAAPRVYAVARSLDGPGYYRDLNSRGEGEVALRGLGAGRFAVRVSPILSGAWEAELEVELDGRSEVVLELELR